VKLLAALVCFAANSLLCRLALASGAIDPASFTTVRLASGALLLASLASGERCRWSCAAFLFGYATCFSFAYSQVTAATGALLLFTAVQATMIIGALLGRERPSRRQWAGLILALSGLGYLLAPSVATPSFEGAMLMLVAGFSWGAYTLVGRGASDPVASTACHFVLASAMALVTSVVRVETMHVSIEGVALGVVSGAITSGLGYVLWFGAVRRLPTATTAAAQLAVPLLTALGGMAFLSETPSTRLVVASVVILVGIYLTLPRRARKHVEWGHGVARLSVSSGES